MNVEAIFAEALAKNTPAERAAYLDEVCGQDEALRVRVETLLHSHEAAGAFLGKPAIERAAEELAGRATGERPQVDLSVDNGDREVLELLTPSEKPDSVGRLGHYEILEIVGRGGMGIVLRAFDDKLHRVVAIKVMAPALAATSPPRKRFLREARAAAQVRHEHVVDIHAVEDQPIPYLVMEYVSGETLQQKLDRVGPLETPEVLRLGQQIARGLAAAHAQGLIHRDIKPSNILLEKGADECVKITDFGLARAADDVSLTQSGMIAGTPMYMAPEQTLGEAIDHRADLFSLGSVLYTMCSGRPPFRATTSMATLKRVAEDQPRPIREIIPEVPQWLCDIIERLHAKKPEERFQSAKEVADLLAQCNQHLEHPTSVPLPASIAGLFPLERGAGGEGRSQSATAPFADSGRPSPRRRRLAVAAAALLLVLGGFTLTEATGVTTLRATVIRIFTPDGTLVVETDDPAVKVTVEGDGDLVITGAGPQEVRLRAGSYRLRATRNGRPVKLDRDLVTITRGDRQIVRVRLEGDAPAAVAPPAERGSFVRLGGKGVAERKFDTLADAVQGASDGDTIEIRGNGPFGSPPIHVGYTALTIRAAEGFRPVLKLSPTDDPATAFLSTNAPMVLEGLEFQRMPQLLAEGWKVIVYSYNAFYAANCRFVGTQIENLISSSSRFCELRNCEFLCHDSVTTSVVWEGSRLVIANCLNAGQIVVANDSPGDKNPASIQFIRNTSVATVPLRITIEMDKWQPALKGAGSSNVLQIETTGNVIDASSALFVPIAGSVVSSSEAEAILAKGVGWKGEHNLYSVSGPFLNFSEYERALVSTKPLKSLADWKQFWASPETGSLTGQMRYHGGKLLAKFAAAPDAVTPEDFRLRADSPGYRAGKDGKDLGADVDLVGPGAAYERWKKMPEYQEWLKESGQVKK